MSERTALYRFYDACDVLLYVGISRSFGRRWSEHAAARQWWPEVIRMTVDWLPDWAAADIAETTAIRDERPRYNIAKTPLVFTGKRPRASAGAFGSHMGAAEIGRLLGVGRQRVQQLVNAPGFAEPCHVLAMGKIWCTDAVIAWAAVHGREVCD
jgi:hypothetical protein